MTCRREVVSYAARARRSLPLPTGTFSVIGQFPRSVRESIPSLAPVVERVQHIRARRPRLPRLPRAPWLRYLLLIGPGIITACAGNDAGGIATYATAGAQYGYGLIWVMIILTPMLAVVQEMCARMGVVTGKGLTDLIREDSRSDGRPSSC